MVTRRADRLGQFKTSLGPATVRGRRASTRVRVDPGSSVVGHGGLRERSRRNRAEASPRKRVEVLRRASAGEPAAGRRLVADRCAAGRAAGRLCHRDGHSRRGRGVRQFSGGRAGLRRRDLHLAAGAHAHSPGRRRQPGRSHGGLALRSADRRLRPAARDGTSGRSRTDQRPDGRPRLRPGDDRAAAVHLDGLHRRRPGRNDRRRGLGRGVGGLRLVGAPGARRGLAGDALALARKRRLARPQHRPKSAAPSRDADYAYRLAVDPPASKELRLFGLASWTIDRFVNRRTRLYQLQYEATRLRERSVLWSMLLVVGANVFVFWRSPPRR